MGTKARIARGSLVGLLALSCVAAAPAQWTVGQPPTPRILLVGDSWAAFQWQDRVFRDALAARGLAPFEERGAVTAIGGSTARQWATQPFLDRISRELVAHPTIDMVHLSIGGNDFLDARPANVFELIQLFVQILTDIRTVVDHIHGQHADARVVYSIYDYVNTGGGFSTELGIFAIALGIMASDMRNFYLVNNLGVLHHRFGFPGEFGPGETPLPGGYPRYQPLLGGDPSLPANPDTFRDQIHPTPQGYLALAEHAVDEFYGAWLGPQVPVAVLPLDGDGLIDPDGDEIVVAIVFGSPDVDATDMKTSTLAFGPLGTTPWLLPDGLVLDLNFDGRPDHAALYRSGPAGFVSGDTEACVQYDRLDGIAVQGCAAIATP